MTIHKTRMLILGSGPAGFTAAGLSSPVKRHHGAGPEDAVMADKQAKQGEGDA